ERIGRRLWTRARWRGPEGTIPVEIERGRPCVLRRPRREVLPVATVLQPSLGRSRTATGSHHEDPDPGLITRWLSFQVDVEPAQLKRGIESGDRRFRTEVHVARIGAGLAAVRPRTDQER